MKRYIKAFLICTISLATVGCGYKYKVESSVKDFLDKNVSITEYNISFEDIDSTRNLTDSMITVMKEKAKDNNFFKKNIVYGTNNYSNVYIYTKAKIYVGSDTIPYTFYLNKTLMNVIAFKKN